MTRYSGIYYIWLILAIVFNLKCPWSRNYSILESCPYVDYGTNCTPDIIDGTGGMSFGLGGSYIYTTTPDIDTSIGIRTIQGIVRKRLSSSVELGFSSSFLFKDRTFYYFVIDTKFRMPIFREQSDIPLLICPDIGFGIGSGRVETIFDFRFSTLFSYPLVRNRADIYLKPKLVFLTYPYHAEVGWFKDVDYATTTIYGISGGFNFSVPMRIGDKRIVRKAMLRPEITYVKGKEPELQRIDFSTTQIGLQLFYLF